MLDLQKGLRASGINLMPNEQRPQLEELNPTASVTDSQKVIPQSPVNRSVFPDEN